MSQTTNVVDTGPLRASEIAERLGVSDRAVQKWITHGLGGRKLKAIRAGGTGMWRVFEKDLDEFLTSNSAPEDE